MAKPRRPSSPPSTVTANQKGQPKHHWQLKVEVLDHWRAGSGRGKGQHLDLLALRDEHQLPYLPGKHLKGLLREALVCLEKWKHAPEGLTELLLGSRAGSSLGAPLCVSNATLSVEEHTWFCRNTDAALHLFSGIAQTSIDATRQVALPKSLRSAEVVVPMTLWADIDAAALGLAAPQAIKDLEDTLNQACGLIRAVGAGRNRGLGRARLSLTPGDSK